MDGRPGHQESGAHDADARRRASRMTTTGELSRQDVVNVELETCNRSPKGLASARERAPLGVLFVIRRWSMAPILRAVLALALFTALGAGPVFAQLDRGQVAGFVKDQSGGVIPGATVVATSMQTGLGRTVITDERGYFVFPVAAARPVRPERRAARLQEVGQERHHASTPPRTLPPTRRSKPARSARRSP